MRPAAALAAGMHVVQSPGMARAKPRAAECVAETFLDGASRVGPIG